MKYFERSVRSVESEPHDTTFLQGMHDPRHMYGAFEIIQDMFDSCTGGKRWDEGPHRPVAVAA